MNPDADINVVAVYPDGTAKVYAPAVAENAPRALIRTERFANYGLAKLWAEEYEDGERRARLTRTRR